MLVQKLHRSPDNTLLAYWPRRVVKKKILKLKKFKWQEHTSETGCGACYYQDSTGMDNIIQLHCIQL